ncbi:4-sulfomuconolactone hydrolase [Maioricimonas rarisocia]|uniref:4-sulfomuconolactone hydrolase n=1 Tax=Maioricimonas rarisocia TaxID=2528026 RepID=A0A517Z8A5_9PLAN|nr:amidohydrolase family protein [Maioricimonas rarisocia]QDU38707.1 4-sulfomuconolactone hydrolase [Maioricimonas rarisocia]
MNTFDRQMGRRDALMVIGSSAAAVMASSARGADDPSKGFIDAHSHIWTQDTDAYPLAGDQTKKDLDPPSFTDKELLAVAHPHGVTRVVLIQHKPYHGLDNSYIVDAIAANPGVFSAVACIEAAADRPQDEMDRLKKKGVRGFRIRPGEGGSDRWSESDGMNAMWRHAAETGLAICPLINPEDLEQVDGMCRRYPETNVVVDHFARVGIDGEIREKDLKALTALAKHPKAHLKVSAYYALGEKQPPHTELIPMIRRCYEAYGPQRLMWGSDCPYQLTGPNTYGDSIALIRERIDFFSDEDRERILRGTAEKVYFS